jgi:hypothetical protein
MRFTQKASISTNISGMTNSMNAGAYGITIPQTAYNSEQLQGMDMRTPFSPGSPMSPRREYGTSPLQYEYMVGQNIVQLPRANERVSFKTIDDLFSVYDDAKLARKVRVDQARTMDWHVRPYDMSKYKDYAKDIKTVEAFFEKPYSGALFSDFQVAIEHDRISYDATAFFKRYTRGGKLGALEPVDGRTIAPIIDFYGHAPLPPAPAYIQWIRGYPEVWLNRDVLMYRPYYKRPDSIYGSPPLEQVLMNANTATRTYLYYLMYFTEGNIPGAYMTAPDGLIDPVLIKQLQTDWDNLTAGDAAQKHRMLITPAGSTVKEFREYAPNSDFSKHLMTLTCAAFDVVPSELGFTESTNKSSGDSQENVQMRRGPKPMMKFYNEMYTDIIHKDFNMPYLKFELAYDNKDEDQLMDAQRWQIFVNCGIASREEAALTMFGHEPTDGIDSGRSVLLGNEVIPVTQLVNGYTGQGNTLSTSGASAPPADGMNPKPTNNPPPADGQQAQPVQKAAADRLKKNANEFPSKVEETLRKSFTDAITAELKKQGDAISLWAEKCISKLGKSDKDNQTLILEIIAIISSQGWNTALAKTLTANITKIFVESMKTTQKEQSITLPAQTASNGAELTAEEIFHSAADDYAGSHIGELITGLDDTTKSLVQNSLQDAIAKGSTPTEISDMLQGNFAFSPSRAMTITRTETGYAWNSGAIGIAKAAGMNAVIVSDGQDFDAECQEADGQTWTVEYAENHQLQHPNCSRSFTATQADPEDIDKGDDDE